VNLKALNKTELDQRMKSLAQKERDLLHEVLLTIKEIDCRRTYLELGFGSLFDYLVQGVGYSEGSAQRRIDAARLIREIPEVALKIQSGELKLNQISLVQKASREVFKTRSLKVSAEEKLQVIQSLCDKSHSQSQQQVAAFFDLPVLQSTHQTVQSDESVRVELTLSKEAHAKIRKAQELLSHAVPNQDLGHFLEYLAEKVIKQKSGKKILTTLAAVTTTTNKSVTAAIGTADTVATSTATVAVNSNQNCCQYTDPQTGQRCCSTWQVQVDHKHSRWAGGRDEAGNLQLLCAGHNRMKYRQEAGIKYLS
jgi:hypothetical protein